MDKKIFTDQYGKTITLAHPPQRIVSLVPSQTELLYDLGIGERVVGITKFCIFPEVWFHSKPRVGGPKAINLEAIKALKPDLIFGNKEENIKEQIEEAEKIAPVWLSDIYTLEDSLEMIAKISDICGVQEKGTVLIQQIREQFAALQPLNKTINVLYLIWKNPFMAVASRTFIHEMLENQLGVTNCMAAQERYPVLDNADLPSPDVVFLSSEPYPFTEKHIAEVQSHFPTSKIMLVDGEPFTWYGSRLQYTPAYFQEIATKLNDLFQE